MGEEDLVRILNNERKRNGVKCRQGFDEKGGKGGMMFLVINIYFSG